SCAEKPVENVDFELEILVDDDVYAGEVKNLSLRNINGDLFEQEGENGEIVVLGDTPLEAVEDNSGLYRTLIQAGEYRLYEDGEDTGLLLNVDLKHAKAQMAYCSSLAYSRDILLKNADTAGIYLIIKDKTFVNLGFDNPLHIAMEQVKSPVSLDMSECPNMTMGYRGFYGLKNLKSMVLSLDMKTLGKESFAFCSNLRRIEIPSSVQTIEGGVFEGCTSLVEIKIDARNKNFTSQNEAVFDKTQRSLVAWPSAKGKIHLPDTVQLLNDYCFAGCGQLESLIMPGVKTVKTKAFKDCVSLSEVEFSASLESLEKNVFEHCGMLEEIKIDRENTVYSSEKGQVLSYDGSVLYAWPSAKKSVVIPDTVSRIDDCAFQNQTGLVQVSFPKSVREIGYQAFSSCTDLALVSMTNVAILESYAFERCTSLKQIELPANLRRIDGGAFAECSSLSSITVQEGNRTYKAQNGAIYSADLKTLVEWPSASGSVTISESVEAVGPYAFNRNYNLKKVVLKNVKSLGHHAFDNCTNMSDITLNEGLTSIGTHVFSNCLALKKIVIPSSVTTIKNYAFWFWTSEQTVACRAPSLPPEWDFAWDADCDAQVVWSYQE
ncbi:MAG: leucine-rich repeat domain-containing protein, partial [Treponema sp.]|nr:leucine-rich repeat domain-containing protein [Treponema sp.]